MSMNAGKAMSVGALLFGALAADYLRTKLVGSYDFPEDNEPTDNSEDKAQDNAGADNASR